MKKYLCCMVVFLLAFSLCNVSFAESTSVELKIGDANAVVNGVGTTLDVAPFIANTGRTLVPLRFISENFGYKVSWDGKNKAIVLFKEIDKLTSNDIGEFCRNTEGYIFQVNNKFGTMYIGSQAQPGWNFPETSVNSIDSDQNVIFNDGYQINPYLHAKSSFDLDQEPIIKDNRVLVPLRVFAERMGFKVDWNGKSKTILITKIAD